MQARGPEFRSPANMFKKGKALYMDMPTLSVIPVLVQDLGVVGGRHGWSQNDHLSRLIKNMTG